MGPTTLLVLQVVNPLKNALFFSQSVTARVNFFYAYLGLQVSALNSDGLMELIAVTAIIARVEKPKSGLFLRPLTVF